MTERRNLLKVAVSAIGFAIVSTAKAETPITLALLHLAPRLGEVVENKRMVEAALPGFTSRDG